MANRILIGVLSAILLIQFAYSTPVSEPKHQIDEDMEFDRFILLIYTTSNFGSLLNTSVIEGKNLMKSVIADPKAATDESEVTKMKEFVERVEKYEKEGDISNSVGELLTLFGKLTLILQHYDAETPNVQHAAIDEILDKGGIKQIGDEFKEGFTKFAEKLNTAITNYLSKLTDEQKVKEQKMIDWQEKFNAEKEVEPKIVMLYHFVELF